MATTTPSGNTRVPTLGDVPDVPADMLTMAVDLEGQAWYTKRSTTVDSSPAAWINSCSLVIPSAPQGRYYAHGILYWFAGSVAGEARYTWVRLTVGGSAVSSLTVGGNSIGSATTLHPAPIQYMFTHAGGNLTVNLDHGFADVGVRAGAETSLFVQRIGRLAS